jgi:glycosyltransferase involved in cell wall biosynthesis
MIHVIKFIIKKIMTWVMICYPRSKPTIKNKSKGFNLIGPPPDRGLGLSLTSISQSLKNLAPVNVIHLPQEKSEKGFSDLKIKSGINLFVGNPDMLLHALLKHPSLMLGGNYNIGLWFWELGEAPRAWHQIRHWVDEIWVQSDFALQAFKKVSPHTYKIPFALDVKVNKKLSRKSFNLPLKPFIFLFTFDYLSFCDRKNPAAIVRSFKKAFGDRHDVYLFIKTTHAKSHPEKERQLKKLIGPSPNIELRDEFLSDVEQGSLMNLCDAYVSLHRSEGLGLGMAEAMALGKPVVATNYSGNLEFMNDKNSLLVRYTKTNLKDDSYLHAKNQAWAEPDVSHAAQFMKKIKDDKAFRDSIAKQASRDMKRFTLKNQQQAILKRLGASHA